MPAHAGTDIFVIPRVRAFPGGDRQRRSSRSHSVIEITKGAQIVLRAKARLTNLAPGSAGERDSPRFAAAKAAATTHNR